MISKKFGLGRGLESLIPRLSKVTSTPISRGESVRQEKQNNFTTKKLSDLPIGKKEQVLEIEVDRIEPNPYQPRKNFDKARLSELAESIKIHGIIQPLVVMRHNDEYQLIAGERRLEAAKLAGLKTVPVIIRSISEQQKLEVALVENIQRDNLNPIERADAFRHLIDQFNLTQDEVAQKVGKSRAAVANTLRLLDLPYEIQKAISENKITEGHARAILSLANKEKQLALFKEILHKKLTVRETESRVKEVAVRRHIRRIDKKDFYIKEIEDRLQEVLGTKVYIRKNKKGGVLNIEFYSKEELESIYNKIVREI